MKQSLWRLIVIKLGKRRKIKLIQTILRHYETEARKKVKRKRSTTGGKTTWVILLLRPGKNTRLERDQNLQGKEEDIVHLLKMMGKCG